MVQRSRQIDSIVIDLLEPVMPSPERLAKIILSMTTMPCLLLTRIESYYL